MQRFEDKVGFLLSVPPYAQPPEVKETVLLEILKEEVEYACQRHPGYRNYVEHWPLDYHSTGHVADVPFLPVGMSVAATDAGCWGNPDVRDQWCRRLAGDVWQFDQQACSSPQVLVLEIKLSVDQSISTGVDRIVKLGQMHVLSHRGMGQI